MYSTGNKHGTAKCKDLRGGENVMQNNEGSGQVIVHILTHNIIVFVGEQKLTDGFVDIMKVSELHRFCLS